MFRILTIYRFNLPWVYSPLWLRAGSNPSPGSGTGFWRRSRGKRAAVGRWRRAGCRGAPSPRSCVGCGSVKASRWWTRRRAGSLDPGPAGWTLPRDKIQNQTRRKLSRSYKNPQTHKVNRNVFFFFLWWLCLWKCTWMNHFKMHDKYFLKSNFCCITTPTPSTPDTCQTHSIYLSCNMHHLRQQNTWAPHFAFKRH